MAAVDARGDGGAGRGRPCHRRVRWPAVRTVRARRGRTDRRARPAGGLVSARVLASAPLFVVLVVTWLLLQGEVTFGNVVGGAALALGIVMLFPVRVGGALTHRLHPWAFLRFAIFVLYSLV